MFGRRTVFGSRTGAGGEPQDETPPPGRAEDVEAPDGVPHSATETIADRVAENIVGGEPAFGPYDAAAPNDGWIRLDLGSLRLPVPEGAQLQVEVDRSGPVRAVHLITGLGQFTITAFAAPRSGGLWREVVPELVTRLRADGGRVGRVPGEWGEEIEAVTEQGVLRFLAVDGPRWMLRGVAVGTTEHSDARIAVLRDLVRQTVVVRGSEALPVRSPLPLQLPGPLGDQLKQATAELVDAAADSG
ncbi:MAG: DUF3710 domain-containing protein [Actinomycetota bacterium]|nr:DUF3710 domain-containing protein [Actinomycetota bacterium]